MKKNNKNNYLDYIPNKSRYASKFIDKDGKVYIKFENTGFYNKIAQIFFGRPRYTNIELDMYGAFIWEHIDGENTIYDIALKVKNKFLQDAEPLYERICKYFSLMADNRLITLK